MDRITKFLDMLQDELEHGTKSQVKDFFLNEVKFALSKIGHSELFNCDELESLAIS